MTSREIREEPDSIKPRTESGLELINKAFGIAAVGMEESELKLVSIPTPEPIFSTSHTTEYSSNALSKTTSRASPEPYPNRRTDASSPSTPDFQKAKQGVAGSFLHLGFEGRPSAKVRSTGC